MASYEIHTDGCVLPGSKGGWAYTIASAGNPGNYQPASGYNRCTAPILWN